MSAFTARLRELAQSDRNRCEIAMPDGDPLVIYARPITGADIEQITRRHKDFASNPTVSAAVDMIILKAETEEGEKAFSVEDKPLLLRLPIGKLNKIREDLFPDESLDEQALEDEVKN